MRRQNLRLVLRLGLGVALWTMALLESCGSDKDRIVEEKVAEQLADFRKRETEKCRQALLVEAERMVDSLLLAEAIVEIEDSIRNARPPKPIKPPLMEPFDSFPVRPIFDTLRR
ncbi:MAG: hypothetical protein NZM43_13185 [Saprospiraceae bacterium]|nr:hypothetical protein [Saprospiraceae bacterium]MDW8485268.1 hypothetical protein [Saprospiraceae bacterium]